MGNNFCSNIVSRRHDPRSRNTTNYQNRTNFSIPVGTQSLAISHDSANLLHQRLTSQLAMSAILGQYPQTMVFVEPGIKKPLSELSEEEQIRLCIRLGLIDQIQTIVYNESNKDKFFECAICMEDYQEGDRLRLLPCFHGFHQMCADDWLQRSFSCPSCQQDLTLHYLMRDTSATNSFPPPDDCPEAEETCPHTAIWTCPPTALSITLTGSSSSGFMMPTDSTRTALRRFSLNEAQLRRDGDLSVGHNHHHQHHQQSHHTAPDHHHNHHQERESSSVHSLCPIRMRSNAFENCDVVG